MTFVNQTEELLCELSRSPPKMQRTLLQAEGAAETLLKLLEDGLVSISPTDVGWACVQATNRRIVGRAD
jgi:hypothetical protein